MPEIVALRSFNTLYIILDVVFLAFFLGLLFVSKRRMTLLFALAGGVLYFIVDYGIFHAALRSRHITGGSLFWVLLWMSLSYGITNFAWIWLWLSRDKRLVEWSVLILAWWISCPIIAGMGGEATVTIWRETGKYHGVMAILLFVGYALLIALNITQKDKSKRVNLLWLVAIGVLVQFGWEFSLMLGGIRSAGFDTGQKILTMITNSLLETNLGMPYIYFIHKALTRRFGEEGARLRPIALPEASNCPET